MLNFSSSDAGASISRSGRIKNQVGLGGRGTGIMCRNLSEGRQLEPVKILKNSHSTSLIWDLCCYYSPSILIQCQGSITIWFSSIQSLSHVRLFTTPWTAAHQASLSITNFWSLLKLMPIESVMPSNHLSLCRPLLLLTSIFPSIRTFPMSQLFASGGQRIGVSVSASVLPMNIQDWFPLGWTSWISLQSKGLSRVFSNTTVQKHWFFSAWLSL